MRRLLVALALLAAGCSSAPSQEDIDSAKRLRAAADQLVKDQETFEASLDRSDGLFRVLEARFLALADRKDKASIERLNVVLHLGRALADARATTNRVHFIASKIAIVADILGDPKEDEAERERVVRELGGLDIELKAAVREEQRFTERVAKARAELDALDKSK